MTTIKNKYLGITHPLALEKMDDEYNELVMQAWKKTNCPNMIHLFNEIMGIGDDSHYLKCDACGLRVHISKIVIPDGKDKKIE